eukprot:CAMPEP_0183720096 /NCGR_PEP_ID=MMETSP0737-20130205/12808_1 /TAXON_ID=385413 /ORGANISM="Thalassiosira miniscula, Strain CCMP1093" /LENGTH=1173 /DNA_ID=CAMNT_0025949907 /DNA_START=242 /DNA_END=3763 /DNA_ORIENTATION=+
MADVSSQAYQYGGSETPYYNGDPFDAVAPSTVAMVILFGSIMFATVGMATRAWLWGDRRAIHAAISIDINRATSNTAAGSVHEYADDMSAVSSGTNLTKTPIRSWEPSFTSTFILFYQISLFGLVLFLIYLIDNHPPHGAARSQSTYEILTESEFDEDQFLFWLIIVVGYGFIVSWQRNDGRPKQERRSLPTPLMRAVSKPTVAGRSEHTIRRRKPGSDPRRGFGSASASVGTSVISGASSESDIEKRLEDVLLEDDDTSFNNVLGSINGDKANKKDDTVSWLEQGSIFLGLDYDENTRIRAIQEVKPDDDILSRHQTLEWKGFLSIALLIYHFNNGGIHRISLNNEGGPYSEDESIGSRAHIYENLTKCAMTSYLFLTGYGHTTYFYYHPANSYDSYRLSRVLTILFRINCSAAFLSLVTGKAEYTACFIVTYCFLLVWLTMRVQRAINYDKYLFRLKLFGLASFIFIVWDCDLSKAFNSSIVQKNSFGSVWELYCISHLHHWAAFCGMVFAINLPIASLQMRKLESLHILTNFMAKGAVFIVLGAALVVWIVGPLQMRNYNVSHPYFGIIPVLAYIYMRNICGAMREQHIGMLSSIGKYSLEIYLLHHHAFTDDGCVLFIPGYPRCNFALVSVVLLLAARMLHNISKILQKMLIPENEEKKCVQHATSITTGVAILYTLARVLDSADMVSVGTISTITIVCGILIFQSVVDMMWADYRGSGLSTQYRSSSDDQTLSTEHDTVKESSAVKISPPLIGTLFFLLAWCIWTFSSNPLQPCGVTANDGHWIPVNPCLARGKFVRDFQAANYISPNDCSEAIHLEWSWLENPQHKHCRYRYRDDMEVQQKLRGRKVVLIGDSSVRSLFLSFCRFMGDHNAGGYEDTTPSHSDAVKSFGYTTFEYKWAPLSIDIVTKLKALKNSGYASNRQPDLVIAGGGAWDKLHLSVTDEDPKSQRDTVFKLAKSLRAVGSPMIWFTPPAINTKALNSDEKRKQMSEENIEEMRQMYDELGVTSSVNFVLDGPSFTRERVSESFDGVHFPPPIMDAGTQIIFNALDWLMPTASSADMDLYLPKPGSLGIPYLGLMMICVALIGLFFFDCYFGVSYLAQMFTNETLSPGELYDTAFADIFKRLKISPSHEKVQAKETSSYYGADKQEMGELLGGRSRPSLSRRRLS